MKSKFLVILTLVFALCLCAVHADGVNIDNGINFVTDTGDIIRTFPDVTNSDYTMYATVNVKNESNLQKDMVLFVSVYDGNNNLKKLSYDTISAPVNGEDIGRVPVTIPRGTEESDFICKAYLWDTIAGKIAYRTESIFLDLNTNLYGITIGDVDIEDYSDDTDFYSVKISKANSEIKVYPKSGATIVQYNEINVPGTSKIKLTDGENTRNITIKTYLEEKDKYTLSALKYKIGDTEYSVEGFDPDINEYTVNLPDNTFYVALLPEAMGEVTCTIQDINDSPNVINGVSFGKLRTDTTGPAYVYERKAIKGVIPIKNENTKAFVNVTDGENTVEYTINFRAVQPRLTEYNLVGAEGDGYVPVFTSGAGFNNDNGTICAADRLWAAANISKKLIGASCFVSPYNNKGGGQWWNDVGKKGDEYFNFTADTAGTVYLLASSSLSEYSGWEKVNNGTVPTHPKDYTLGDKTWNDYDTDYFMSCVKWNSDRGRCDECGVKPIKESQVSYIDGCVPYKYVFAKHFEAGEKVSIKHTGAYGNSAAEIIWAVVWDVDVNYPDVPDEPEDDETGDIEIDENLPEGIKNIASYALDGFLFNQLSNNWAEVTLEGSTDEATGVITTTATYSGKLAKGKRIATFQPWAEKQGVGNNAAGNYTMHFGFTVNEITSPVYLEYNYSRDGGGKKTLISLSDKKVVVGGDINGEKYIEVTEPYTINMFMNIVSCEGYIYVNDQLLYKGTMRNSSADITWREVRVFSLSESEDIKFVTTAANSSIYKSDITIGDVINAYVGDELPTSKAPIVILKLDDLCNDNVDNFQKAYEILKSYNISSAGFGLIGNHLEDDVVTDELISKMKMWDNEGIEIWHHGYSHTESEYSTADYESQKNSFGRTCELLKEKAGITITSFGSPFNNANETTIKVIKENFPQIKCLMLVNASVQGITNIRSRANFETQVGVVSYDTFVKNYESKMGESVVVMQGHAGAWRDADREEFKKILTYLKDKDAIFMTPTEYAEYVGTEEPPVEPDEPGDDEPEGLKVLEPYALSGYFNKQLNNAWADVELSDETAENGVITTTATYEGNLAKGKRVATFQPWEKGQGTRENAAGAYTMHYGFTVNELSSPIMLTYKYDQGGAKNLVSLTDKKVVAGGSLDGSKYIDVTAPYTVNIFMNIQSGNGYVYVNDQLLYEGGMTNSSGDKKWHEVRVTSLEDSTNFKLVTTAANSSIYKDDISIEEVIKVYLGDGVIGGDEEEKEEDIPEGINSLSSYALSGYFYKQINNNWAEITLSDETAENGVITTTATYAGTLASGKRVASFQPWDKNKPTLSKAQGAYTMHFGFTVNEITSPACLEYRFDASKKLISFSDSKVVWGDNMNGDTYIEVTAPYTIDIFMNVQTAKGIIYVNGQVLYDGTIEGASSFCNSGADTKWTEVRVKNLDAAEDFKLVTTAANSSVYNDEVTFEEVVAAYMGDGESGEDPDEPEELPEAVKNLSEYALSGYFDKQINNFWSEVTLADETDENGVITTTASYDGTLAAGKRIGTFQPWEEKGVGSNAAGAYTMHFGFNVNEITSPVYLEYNYSRNGGAKKTLLSLSESRVAVGGSISGSTSVQVDAPYRIDIFMNIETCEGYIYVNKEFLYKGVLRNSGNDKTWREARVFSLDESEDIRFVTTAASSSVYNDRITIEEVIEAYMGDGE